MGLQIRQIITYWTTINGGGKVSVMYFTSGNPVEDQRDSLEQLFDSCMAACDNSTSFVIRTEGVEVDDANGVLLGAWNDTTARTGTGAGAGEPVADASQILIRWRTPAIVEGRFVTGRTNVPGMGNGNLVNGNVGTSAQAIITGAANQLVNDAVGFGVWHRPLKDDDGNVIRDGSFHEADSGNCWTELGVLRRRRF